ncbi:MAG: N-acyl homoserine lactonase family protein [Chloroflexota bacterium]
MARIHHIVTGELEMSLGTALLNGAITPDIPRDRTLPLGYGEAIPRRDGTTVEGFWVPIPAWLIEQDDRLILVDTGLGDLGAILAANHLHGPDFAGRKRPEHDLTAGLARHGVTPADIDLVLLTHLHFDHVGNNELFPRARFLTQRDEISYAVSPPPFSLMYWPEYAHKVRDVLDRVEPIDGDRAITDQVRVLRIGGHSPGCMVVVVETDAGRVCLASDVMYTYRNVELDWPIGVYWDLRELLAGHARIRESADVIVPGHDWEFLDHFPTGTIG